MLPKFERLAPASLQEAIRISTDLNDSARLYAGGTDVFVRMRTAGLNPRYLIDLKGIPGLRGIEYSPGNGLKIGALTTFHELEASPAIQAEFAALLDAASRVGSPQIRNYSYNRRQHL